MSNSSSERLNTHISEIMNLFVDQMNCQLPLLLSFVLLSVNKSRLMKGELSQSLRETSERFKDSAK